MATLLDTYNLITERSTTPPPDLLQRTVAAVATAAIMVLTEDIAKPNHDARVKWARAALNDPIGMSQRMFVGVAANPTIADKGDSATDGDVQFTVNGLVDAFANTV